MKSNTIIVDGTKESMLDVMQEVNNTAKYNELNEKQTNELTLLSEEMIGMQKNMAHANNGEYFIEAEDGCYKLHLLTKTEVDFDTKDEYMKLATDKSNAAYKGFTGKLAMIADAFTQKTVPYNMVSNCDMGVSGNVMSMNLEDCYRQAWVWSQDKAQNTEANQGQEWDELEKSIVEKLADEIVIGTRNNYVETIVYKDFNKE